MAGLARAADGSRPLKQKTNFSETVYAGVFELADSPYNLKASGSFVLHAGPCP